MFQTILARVFGKAPAGASPQQILFGDFNGDGVKDIAVPFITNRGSNGDPILFYLGDGKGSYTEATSTLFPGPKPLPVFAARIVAGDLNRDNKPDILVLDYGMDAPPFPGGQSEVILTNPDGTLTLATGNVPRKLNHTHGGAIGDINNDGKADAVLFNIDSNKGDAVQILLGDGAGHFEESNHLAPKVYTTTPGYITASTWGRLIDVNHDNYLDLVIGDGQGNAALRPSEIYLNNGRGDFSSTPPIILPDSPIYGQSVMQIEPVDLNNDGHIDLVLSITNADNYLSPDFYHTAYLQLLINDGNGHFRDETPERLPQSTAKGNSWIKFVQSADVNHDGALDLITSSSLWSDPWMQSQIYLNDGLGHFQRMKETIDGFSAPAVDDANKVTSFHTFRWMNPEGGQTLLVLENDAVGVAAPVIRAPDISSLPAALAHRFFTQNASPSVDRLAALSDFAFDQYLAYKQNGVARAELGPYEALGRGFAETASFQKEYGSMTSAGFVESAYQSVFERTATSAQLEHFKTQAAHFESIYGKAGLGGTLASLLAKGAVIGQMLGIAAFDETSRHSYISDARVSLGLAASQATLVGVAQRSDDIFDLYATA